MKPDPGLGPGRERRALLPAGGRPGRLRRRGRRGPRTRSTACTARCGRRATTAILPLVAEPGRPVAQPRVAGQGARGVHRAEPARSWCWPSPSIHHLVISRNVPMQEFVDFLADAGGDLVVEFPTPEDPMVQGLLRNKREGIHDDYTVEVLRGGAGRAVRRPPAGGAPVRHPDLLPRRVDGDRRGRRPDAAAVVGGRTRSARDPRPCGPWPVPSPCSTCSASNAEFFLAAGVGPGRDRRPSRWSWPSPSRSSCCWSSSPFRLLRRRSARRSTGSSSACSGAVLGPEHRPPGRAGDVFVAALLLGRRLRRPGAVPACARPRPAPPCTTWAWPRWRSPPLFVFSSDAGRLVFAEDAEVVDVEQGTGGPVAVVVFDELPLASLMTREGKFNDQRFPNFARLANQATWYRNATSVAPSTPESVPTILTGEYPEWACCRPRPTGRSTSSPCSAAATRSTPSRGSPTSAPTTVCVPEEAAPGVGSFVDDLLRHAGRRRRRLRPPHAARADAGRPAHARPVLGRASSTSRRARWTRPPHRTSCAATTSATSSTGLGGPAPGSRGGQGLDLVPLIDDYDAVDGIAARRPRPVHAPPPVAPHAHAARRTTRPSAG